MSRRPAHAHRQESRLVRFGYWLAIIALIGIFFIALTAVDADQLTVWRVVGDVR